MKITRRESLGVLASLVAAGNLPAAADSALPSAPSQTQPPAPAPTSEKPAQTPAADQAFQDFVDRYFDGFFHFQPGRGTREGLHQYDAELPAYSRQDMEAEISRNRRALEELAKIPRAGLSDLNKFDARLLETSIRAHLHDLENIRLWEKDPNFYAGAATSAVFGIIRRDYASLDTRLKAIVARERRFPDLLASARANVQNPPPVFTRVAISQVQAELGFLQNDLPQAVEGARDAAIKAEFQQVNQQAIASFQQFLDYLQKDLTPRSHGQFAIGEVNYRKKLAYDEMVETPLERLLRIGEKELRQTQASFAQVAQVIDSTQPPLEVLRGLSKEHPDAAHVIPDTQAVLNGLRDFVATHDIVTLPAAPVPQVVETPPFMRAITFASMDTPGPYEEFSSQAFYNVTLPDPSWSDEKKEENLRGFNPYATRITSIHEVYPGHYVQFLRLKQAPSKGRKLAGSLHSPWGEIGTNGEGWAHYCEQMMLAQGYGEGDPRLLLFQLQAALLRLCRYLVGIRMHTRGLTIEAATDFFVQQGYMEQVEAEREALRGASDPTYLVYTLGKLEIMKLRDDYQKKMGDKYKLKDFHDQFLSYGPAPIPMIREEMLGDHSAVL